VLQRLATPSLHPRLPRRPVASSGAEAEATGTGPQAAATANPPPASTVASSGGGSGAAATVTFPPPVVSPHTVFKAMSAAFPHLTLVSPTVHTTTPAAGPTAPVQPHMPVPGRSGMPAASLPTHPQLAVHYPYPIMMHPAAMTMGLYARDGRGAPLLPQVLAPSAPAAEPRYPHPMPGYPPAHMHVAWERAAVLEHPDGSAGMAGQRRRRLQQPSGAGLAGTVPATGDSAAPGAKRPRRASPGHDAAPARHAHFDVHGGGGGGSRAVRGGGGDARAYMSRSSTSASSAPSGSEIVSDGEEWDAGRQGGGRGASRRLAANRHSGTTGAPGPAGHSIAVSGGTSGAGRDASLEREGQGDESVASGSPVTGGVGGSLSSGCSHLPAIRGTTRGGGDAASSAGVRSSTHRPDPLQPAWSAAAARVCSDGAVDAAVALGHVEGGDEGSDDDTEWEEGGGGGGGGGSSAAAAHHDATERHFMEAMVQRMLDASAQLSARDHAAGDGGGGAAAAGGSVPRAITSRAAEQAKVRQRG